MKVNLLLGRPELARSGYLNLDASITQSEGGRVPCALNDWPGVSPNEAREIIANHVLEYVPVQNVVDVFSYWVSRLAVGGRLVVSCVDCAEVAFRLRYETSPYEICNELLYAGRQSAHTVESISQLFQDGGLKVVWKMLNGLVAVVEGERHG